MEHSLELLEHSPDGILLLDRNGLILAASRRAARLLGSAAPEELRGASLPDLLSGSENKEDLQQAITQVGYEEPVLLDCLFARPANAPWPACISLLAAGEVVACSLREVAPQHLEDSAFRKLYREMRDAFVIVNMKGDILECNEAYLDLTGYTREELASMTYQGLTPPLWHPLEEEIVRSQVLKRGYSDVYEKEYRRKDGRVVPIELRTILSRDERGQPSAMWAIIRDVTERKRTEEALRRSEQTNRAILNASLASIFLIDLRGTILALNQAAAGRLGRKPDELLGKCAYDLFPPEVAESRRRQVDAVARTGRLLRYEDERQGIWFDNQIHPLPDAQGKVYRLVIIAYDISEKKQTEAALRASEQRYRELAENADDPIFMLDPQARIMYMNEFGARVVGLRPEQMVGMEAATFFEPREWERAERALLGAISTGEPATIELTNKFPSGNILSETRLIPLKQPDGTIYAVLGIARDLTERKRDEKILRDSEERYRSLAESAPDAIFILDSEGRLQYVNPFAAGLFGKLPADFIGKKPGDFHPDERLRQEVRRAFESQQTCSYEDTAVIAGRQIWLNFRLVPLHEGASGQRRILCVARDISDLKHSELALIQAGQQLEARVAERTAELETARNQMRQLAAQVIMAQETERRSVARDLHDDTGPLLITLKYNLSAMLDDVTVSHSPAKQEQLRQAIRGVDETIQHIRALSHSLRPPTLEVGGLDIALKDFCREFSRDTRLRISYRGEMLPTLPDDIAISLYRFVQEALTNIAKHARASAVSVTLRYRQGVISLSVQDNGRGFSPPPGNKGIGLLNIEERLGLLGGTLQVRTREGGGARLTASIPLQLPGSAPESKESQ